MHAQLLLFVAQEENHRALQGDGCASSSCGSSTDQSAPTSADDAASTSKDDIVSNIPSQWTGRKASSVTLTQRKRSFPKVVGMPSSTGSEMSSPTRRVGKKRQSMVALRSWRMLRDERYAADAHGRVYAAIITLVSRVASMSVA